MKSDQHESNASYEGECLERAAFPLGGIGAGMLCVEGSGKLSHVSLHGRPEIYNEPAAFAALSIKGLGARVVEGPVSRWKLFFPWSPRQGDSSGNGGTGRDYGLPRYSRARFTARFPFATVDLDLQGWPAAARIGAWSPFIPGRADDSSLPVAALEYTFRNEGTEDLEAVFSFNSRNFMAPANGGGAGSSNGSDGPKASVGPVKNGFVLRWEAPRDRPWEEGAFAAVIDDPEARVKHRWFRGGWFDPLSILWREIESGRIGESPPIRDGEPSPGGSVFLPLLLKSGHRRTVRLLLGWYVPGTNLCWGPREEDECEGGEGACSCSAAHTPWYAGRFASVEEVMSYWRGEYGRLKEESLRFSTCFYDTDLSPAVVEAAAANLTILKSPTVLRQTDGRLWCWEGCCDSVGCCPGSCTHVWNYAQALPHLFPELERTFRQTEFHEAQSESGHQAFRVPLPIRPPQSEMVAAADGQLGGIMKVHREWRISGDSEWLRGTWALVRRSLDYCIELWDPEHQGVLIEPHHNTYDIEFWGPDGMCSSIYVGALKAAVLMGEALSEDVDLYRSLFEKGRRFLEEELFNGEYFEQRIRWQGLRAGDPTKQEGRTFTGYDSEESLDLLKKEGPKYQYGTGCLSDGVIGAWMAEATGVGEILDPGKVESHLLAVYRHNFRRNLADHANPQRPTFAAGREGGLLLCSWPRGGKPSLPFVYSDEVWTGIEYQVASHLMMTGHVEEGLRIVETCRSRYDGRVRNPFNEYECGHWYARAMASYALIQGLSGARYDAVSRVLFLRPSVRGDFRAFLCTAGGFGTVGVKDGEPFLEARSGSIPVDRIDYRPT